MTLGLLFAAGADDLDYGRRLSRLRWRRAFPGATPREAAPETRAAQALEGAARWIAVRQESALPLPGARVAPSAGEVSLPAFRGSLGPEAPHTLRELSDVTFRPDLAASLAAAAEAPALAFRAADFAPSPNEPLGGFLARLALPPTPRAVDAGFTVFAFDDPSDRARPEVARHVPATARRLLDVGCGAGGASAALKRERPGLSVTGVERSPKAAARARERLDRVHDGEAGAVLPRLLAEQESYDAFLFADVLEHVADPVALLTAARGLAAEEATLVASVPNVGHLSIVRDLSLGRFDPVPAGLLDAGHLRWFTRGFLREALTEAGWSVSSIEPVAGAPARDAERFLAHFGGRRDLDRESLRTYQWIAVARTGWTRAGQKP